MALSYLNANEALPHLLHRVLTQGHTVGSRNGDTKELIMQQITLQDPADQKEITVPGRKVSLPAQIAETMWILAGRNDTDWLSHYLPRAAEFADDGKHWRGGYGPRLRRWVGNDGIRQDQLKHIVDLLQADPGSRRAVFTIYNPQHDNKPGKDIPCNNWVHFLPRDGVLHAHVAIRSNDLFWGWSGINAFEWTSLLQIVSALVGLETGSITFSISSLHLYERHWDKAAEIVTGVKQRGIGISGVETFQPGPVFKFFGASLTAFDLIVQKWFELEGQIRKGGLSDALLQQVENFPEPMFRSWLYVLLAWHHDDMGFVSDKYPGTALAAATALSPKRKKPEAKVIGLDQDTQMKLVSDNRDLFTDFCHKLHVEKNAAYGNSWMKRGEMLGIMANCARKVDRLGVGGAGDTAADTAIDLLMYFIKYDLWLDQQKHSDWHITEGEAHVDAVHNYLQTLAGEKHTTLDNQGLIRTIKNDFDNLENLVTEKRADRGWAVKQLIAYTYPLALRLWAKEERAKANSEGDKIDAFLLSAQAIGVTPVSHADRNSNRFFNGYNV